MIVHTLLLITALAFSGDHSPKVSIAYDLKIDPARVGQPDVSITFRNAPDSFHLAIRVHGEYDAQYWRYLQDVRIESSSSARITRLDSTLWLVSLPRGSGVVRYRIAIQPQASAELRVWKPQARADGMMINPPDFFLYSPELAQEPVTLHLDIPPQWGIATALPSHVPDAATLLDSPILLGNLHQWAFTDGATRYHVAYWPLPNGNALDTLAFVDNLHRLVRAATGIFGAAPAREYWFLVEEGGGDALEHAASVVVGIHAPSFSMQEIAHEFFHAWNLVAIRPDGYNELSYRAPRRTPSLWIGEGITLYYADLLQRRAGLMDTSAGASRLAHVTRLLERYYGSPVYRVVSPERASLAFGDAPADNPDATGGYYLQGELLGNVLDALVRDSTREARGVDDVMRAMFARSLTSGDRGYAAGELEQVADSVCRCRLDSLFAREVRGADEIDMRPVLGRLGLREIIDSIPAIDSAGNALPDLRLLIDFTLPAAPRLVIRDSTTPWAKAGLRTGDRLLTINGEPVRTFQDFRRAVTRMGEMPVGIERQGQRMQMTVAVSGYRRARVQIIDAAVVTSTERARRDAWLRGED